MTSVYDFGNYSPDPTPVPDPISEVEPKPKPKAASKPAAKSATGTRRLVQKVLAVVEAELATREATAWLLNVSDAGDDEALSVAVLDAGKSAGQPISDVLSIAEIDDPYGAMAAAIGLAEKSDRFAAAWRVLASVADLGGRPGSLAKAGPAFAKAANSLTSSQLDVLRLPLELIG